MITAETIRKFDKRLPIIEQTIQVEMPGSFFSLKGLDNDFVYFDVIKKVHTDAEVRSIKEKTTFYVISESFHPFYKGSFKDQIK